MIVRNQKLNSSKLKTKKIDESKRYLSGGIRCGAVGGKVGEPASKFRSGGLGPATGASGSRFFVVLDYVVKRHIHDYTLRPPGNF